MDLVIVVVLSQASGQLIPAIVPYLKLVLFRIFTENGQSSTFNTGETDSGAPVDNAFRMNIQYYPFISSKAIIYKDDESGFQIEKTTYMNEDAQVNDPTLLGSVAKNRVNRLGGTEYTKSGYVSSLRFASSPW